MTPVSPGRFFTLESAEKPSTFFSYFRSHVNHNFFTSLILNLILVVSIISLLSVIMDESSLFI